MGFVEDLNYALENLSRFDGFKSSEQMFAYFNKKYDLNTPKQFYVYRWRWG